MARDLASAEAVVDCAMPEVLLAGVSTRAAAQSAVRAGYRTSHHRRLRGSRSCRRPKTHRCRSTRSAASTRARGVSHARRRRPMPSSTARASRTTRARSSLSRRAARCGATRPRRCDTRALASPAAATRFAPPGFTRRASSSRVTRRCPHSDVDWLVKPLRSGGGHGVRPWRGRRRAARPLRAGVHRRAVRVGGVRRGDGRAVPLGITRQLVGDAAFGASGFRYCGSILCAAGGPLRSRRGAGGTAHALALAVARTSASWAWATWTSSHATARGASCRSEPAVDGVGGARRARARASMFGAACATRARAARCPATALPLCLQPRGSARPSCSRVADRDRRRHARVAGRSRDVARRPAAPARASAAASRCAPCLPRRATPRRATGARAPRRGASTRTVGAVGQGRRMTSEACAAGRRPAVAALERRHAASITIPEPIRPAIARRRLRRAGARSSARSAAPLFGWKIAATSKAGQAHINVDGPLAGRLLRERAFESGATVPFGANHMRVAEAEFAFRMGRDLTPQWGPFSVAEVRRRRRSLHPAIEIPDSRFDDFTIVGAAAADRRQRLRALLRARPGGAGRLARDRSRGAPRDGRRGRREASPRRRRRQRARRSARGAGVAGQRAVGARGHAARRGGRDDRHLPGAAGDRARRSRGDGLRRARPRRVPLGPV